MLRYRLAARFIAAICLISLRLNSAQKQNREEAIERERAQSTDTQAPQMLLR
jgi:hypothetical protein